MKASAIIDCTCTVANLSGYVLHSSISVKKRKKEKGMKMGFGFHSKVIHVYVYGKSGILVCNFLVSCDSRVGPVSQTAIVQIFSLWYSRLSKAYAINCSCFATGAQNTLHKQQKKERIKVNHLWPHFLVIPNSPVQFFPFPVYPGWQSHTCDPFVLVQFAFSWQELFPLHSSTSMKSQMKKWHFKNCAKIAMHKPLLCERVQAMAVFNLLLDCENARLSYLMKK